METENDRRELKKNSKEFWASLELPVKVKPEEKEEDDMSYGVTLGEEYDKLYEEPDGEPLID